MSIDPLSFAVGAAIGSVATYKLWRWTLQRTVGEILSGKRKWRIGGRQFTIVECK